MTKAPESGDVLLGEQFLQVSTLISQRRTFKNTHCNYSSMEHSPDYGLLRRNPGDDSGHCMNKLHARVQNKEFICWLGFERETAEHDVQVQISWPVAVRRARRPDNATPAQRSGKQRELARDVLGTTNPSTGAEMEKMEKLERRSHMAPKTTRFTPFRAFVKLLPGYQESGSFDGLRPTAVSFHADGLFARSQAV